MEKTKKISTLSIMAIIISVISLLAQFLPDLALAVQSSSNSVPQLVSYQGRLTDATGIPINGEVDMEFCLYDQATGGTSLWCESYDTGSGSGIAVEFGVFDVALGSLILFPENLFNNPNLFLGVSVNGEAELLPRRQMVSGGFSHQSSNADRLDGLDANEFALQNALNASDGDPINAVFVDSEGQVGIGSTIPEFALDVVGDLRVSGSILSGGQLAFHSQAVDDYYQSIPTNSWTKVVLNDERLDTLNNFDNSRFTAPEDGIYSFSAYLVWNSTDENYRYQVRLLKNSSVYDVVVIDVKTIGHDGVSTSEGTSFSFVAFLEANDYLEMEVYQNTGSSQTLGNWSYLTGFKVP